MKVDLKFKINNTVSIIVLIALMLTLFVLYDMGILTGQNPRDTRRMKDMSVIIAALEVYAKDHNGVFPESLDVLSNEKYLTKVFAHPVTLQPYKYVFDSEGNYSVCTYVVDRSQKCLFTNAKKLGF